MRTFAVEDRGCGLTWTNFKPIAGSFQRWAENNLAPELAVLGAAASLLVSSRTTSPGAMTAGMLSARKLGFFACLRTMTLRAMCVMCAGFVLVVFVVFCRFLVMTRGVFVMLSGAVVMLGGWMLVSHCRVSWS
jgi:hypothetical protein